jgi:hypothetical protein
MKHLGVLTVTMLVIVGWNMPTLAKQDGCRPFVQELAAIGGTTGTIDVNDDGDTSAHPIGFSHGPLGQFLYMGAAESVLVTPNDRCPAGTIETSLLYLAIVLTSLHNGDQLYAKYDRGYSCFDAAAGTTEITFTGRFTGGTGKFAGATGDFSGEFHNVIHVADDTGAFATGQGTWTGELCRE